MLTYTCRYQRLYYATKYYSTVIIVTMLCLFALRLSLLLTISTCTTTHYSYSKTYYFLCSSSSYWYCYAPTPTTPTATAIATITTAWQAISTHLNVNSGAAPAHDVPGSLFGEFFGLRTSEFTREIPRKCNSISVSLMCSAGLQGR